MKIVYRPVGGGLAEAMGRTKQFDTIKEMFEFLVEQHNHAFEINNLYISYYGYDSRIDWDTYLITTTRYGRDKYDTPQATGYCAFK